MRALRAAVVGGVVLFLTAPLLVVTVASFNRDRYLDFPVEEYSTGWYGQLVTDSQWRGAMSNSLTIGLASATLAVLIALPLAYGVHTYRPRLAPVLMGLGVLPFMLPPVISAVGALVFWNRIGQVGRIENVIVAHAVFFSSVPLVTISLGLQAIDPAVGEAASTLGAAPRQRFRTVTLPLLVPSIVTGFVAAFVLSLNEYIIAFMVAGFTVETLPIKIFNSLRYGFTPTIAAVSVVFTLLSLVALTILARLGSLERLLGADHSGH
ncbi:MAG TPA: ABC transporter permease [Acidimicrobiales bacterium]|nr:ABC transporter permease [Acidimicrobiales bacterium]